MHYYSHELKFYVTLREAYPIAEYQDNNLEKNNISDYTAPVASS